VHCTDKKNYAKDNIANRRCALSRALAELYLLLVRLLGLLIYFNSDY